MRRQKSVFMEFFSWEENTSEVSYVFQMEIDILDQKAGVGNSGK